MAVAYSCFITYLFFMPTSGLPKVGISGFDKVIHSLLFAVFMLLWQLWLYLKGWGSGLKFVFLLLALTLCYGILIEVFQELFTDSRTADPYDVVADMIGALIGIAMFQGLKSKIKPKR